MWQTLPPLGCLSMWSLLLSSATGQYSAAQLLRMLKGKEYAEGKSWNLWYLALQFWKGSYIGKNIKKSQIDSRVNTMHFLLEVLGKETKTFLHLALPLCPFRNIFWARVSLHHWASQAGVQLAILIPALLSELCWRVTLSPVQWKILYQKDVWILLSRIFLMTI